MFFQFKSFLTIFVFVLLSSANVLFAQTQNTCPPTTTGCGKVFNTISLIAVPGFPECKLSVAYDFRICQGVFQIYNVKIAEIDYIGCEAWLVFAYKLFGSQDELAKQLYVRKFNKAIGSQLLDELAQNVAMQQDPTPFYCGTGANTIAGSFYPGGCVSTCIGQLPNGKLVFRQVSCKGGDLCCGLKRTYCISPKNNQPILLSETTEETGSCSSISLSDCPVVDNVVWGSKSPCFPTCEPKGTDARDEDSTPFVSTPLHRVSKNIGGNYVSVKLFPNPTHDCLNLFFETKFSGKVTLLNLRGQALQTAEITDGSFTKFDVSNQVKGTYILLFEDSNNNTSTETIIID